MIQWDEYQHAAPYQPKTYVGTDGVLKYIITLSLPSVKWHITVGSIWAMDKAVDKTTVATLFNKLSGEFDTANEAKEAAQELSDKIAKANN